MARIVRRPARVSVDTRPGRRPPAGLGGPAVETTKLARLLLDYLELEGTTTVFGVPGGAIKDLLAELGRRDGTFRYVVTRHETGAAYMADAFARVSGRPGVLAVTSGPGATNALTGVMNAQTAGSPVLVITGEVAQQYFGKGYLQAGFAADLDVAAAFAAASEYSAVVTSPENFATLMEQALRDALSLPNRAVHLSIPDDVGAATLTGAAVPASPSAYRASCSGSDRESAAEVARLLAGAQRPVILLGNGCRRVLRDPEVAAALAGLVDRLAVPVMTTPNAKGLFPESHPLSLRNYGRAACPWSIAYCEEQGLDLVLVLGSALGDWATAQWHRRLVPAGSRLVQVDIDPSVIGRGFPVHRGVVAEVGRFVTDLAGFVACGALPGGVEERRARVAELKAGVPARPRSGRMGPPTPGVDPARAMAALSETLRGPLAGAHVFVDSGNCVGWSLGHLVIDPPTELHNSLAMGPMGFATAGVVGAQLACPDRPCVAVVGDGAMLMHGTEISTARRYGVAPIWVVLDDGDQGMVTQGMTYFFGKLEPGVAWDGRYTLGADLVGFAESLGAEAFRIDAEADMNDGLERAAKGAAAGLPQVLVVSIDRSPVPPYYPALDT